MTKTSLTIIVNSNPKVYQDKTIIVSLKLLNDVLFYYTFALLFTKSIIFAP